MMRELPITKLEPTQNRQGSTPGAKAKKCCSLRQAARCFNRDARELKTSYASILLLELLVVDYSGRSAGNLCTGQTVVRLQQIFECWPGFKLERRGGGA